MTEWHSRCPPACQCGARRARGLLIGWALLSLAACGGGGSGTGAVPAPPPQNLTGTCVASLEGTRDGQPVTASATYDLVQDGTGITGTWSTDDGASGDLSGVISGATLTFTLTQTVPCAGTFNGQATASAGSVVAGSYAGNSPCRGAEVIQLVITSCQPKTP
ncbi:MAG: hypothetical protein ACE5IK_07520 [Acidobacteriota bacterium]